jgi:hypothetical protein
MALMVAGPAAMSRGLCSGAFAGPWGPSTRPFLRRNQGGSRSHIVRRDLEAAAGAIGPVATLMHGCADDLGHEALDGPADARMLPRQRRQRTSHATDDVLAILLDARHGTKLVVEHLTGCRDASSERSRHARSGGELVGEALPGSSQNGVHLIC